MRFAERTHAIVRVDHLDGLQVWLSRFKYRIFLVFFTFCFFIAIGLLTPKNMIAAIKSGVFFSLFNPVFKPAQPQVSLMFSGCCRPLDFAPDFGYRLNPSRFLVQFSTRCTELYKKSRGI